jgi:catechol 2,3-dioxygenase-like lactoylglutathione lyase family enzyme
MAAGIGYVMVGTNDLARARLWYDAVLVGVLGGAVVAEYPVSIAYRLPDGTMVWLTRPYDRKPATVGNGMMVGLNAISQEKVNAAHAAALAAGGADEGAPGARPLYGPGVYCAYARDLDGNKYSFVHDAAAAA